jgi:hypothetical protein
MSVRGARRHFYVADLDARGELRSVAPYAYAELEQIPRAIDLISSFSALVWRSPDEFELNPLPGTLRLNLRWRATSQTAGIATLRSDSQVASVSLLVSGMDADGDQITLAVFQKRLLHELHDSGFEPSFALMGLQERPLVATINVTSPEEKSESMAMALADRCFAASFFRYHGLA